MWLYMFKSQFVSVTKNKKEREKSDHQGYDYKGGLLYMYTSYLEMDEIIR
jgi:hypothetical protein